jgi:hypothetical protein
VDSTTQKKINAEAAEEQRLKTFYDATDAVLQAGCVEH